MSKQKTKIAKIVINIDGEQLELSPKQAKELRDILCDLYGDNVVENHHYHDRYRYWNTPYWGNLTDWGNLTAVSGGAITTTSSGFVGASTNTSDTVYLIAA